MKWALAIAVGLAAVILAAWLFAPLSTASPWRPEVLDPRPLACPAGPRRTSERNWAEQLETRPTGQFEHALSTDGCLRLRTQSFMGRRLRFSIFELRPDGNERVHFEGKQRWSAQRWQVPHSADELEPLPEYFWPTELVALTWFSYPPGDELPALRVERSWRRDGAEVTELQATRKGGQWVETPARTVRLDLAPERPGSPAFKEKMKKNADY